jgi:glycosyltransferase involved in cell wall biosynthesis
MPVSIAIIVPSHNRSEELRRALAGIWQQTTLPDEVVVIDDGSVTPVEAAVLAGAPATVRTKLLRNDRPLGANSARNRGVSAATSDWVAFLDDDDEYVGDKLRQLRDRVASEPSAGVIHHGASVIYDNQSVSYPTKVNRDIGFQSLLTGNKVGGMSLACVRRDLLIEVGGLDESLPALQDWDLWLRLAKREARFVAIDKALTTYHFVTGKPAISKSLDRLNQAMEIIDGKFADDIAKLSPAQRLARRRTDVGRYAHRMSMNGQNGAAALTYLKGGVATRSLKLIAAAPVALLGIRSLALLRRLGG